MKRIHARNAHAVLPYESPRAARKRIDEKAIARAVRNAVTWSRISKGYGRDSSVVGLLMEQREKAQLRKLARRSVDVPPLAFTFDHTVQRRSKRTAHTPPMSARESLALAYKTPALMRGTR